LPAALAAPLQLHPLSSAAKVGRPDAKQRAWPPPIEWNLSPAQAWCGPVSSFSATPRQQPHVTFNIDTSPSTADPGIRDHRRWHRFLRPGDDRYRSKGARECARLGSVAGPRPGARASPFSPQGNRTSRESGRHRKSTAHQRNSGFPSSYLFAG